MIIYLIRHGNKNDDDKNLDSSTLTSLGIMQANKLGKRFKNYGIQKIYSSPMLRAVQTAEEMNKYINTSIDIRSELREIHMGDWNEKGKAFVHENYPDFIEEFSKHLKDIPYPPNGECGADVWNRTKNTLFEIANGPFEKVALVTHGGVIRAIVSGILGVPQERRFYIGAKLENCGITTLKFDATTQTFFVHNINDAAHLEN